MLAQFEMAPIKRCVLQYRGEVATKNTRLITSSFAVGLLTEALEQETNIVNAEVLLRERGVELVEERRSDMGAFSSVVMAEVHTDRNTHRAAGTVVGKEMLRLIQLDHFRLEAFLDGVLMVFTHNDEPGIIGSVGTIFGRHKINIAQMAVGRETKGGEAIGVLNLDQPPTAAAMDEVRAHPAIKSAIVVTLPPAGQKPAWLAG
jgi:D-3-phosphoglycerate dehydrogenase